MLVTLHSEICQLSPVPKFYTTTYRENTKCLITYYQFLKTTVKCLPTLALNHEKHSRLCIGGGHFIKQTTIYKTKTEDINARLV